MANDMLNTKKLMTKVLNGMDNSIRWVDFSTSPSSYSTGSKTYTMTIPSGYKVVTNKPYEIFVSGDANSYITDRTLSVSGSTLTVHYYLYNPNNRTNLVIIGSILFVKESGASLSVNTNLVDMFYPIGSYYETSDTSFNPSATWGGSWTSETITDDVVVEEGKSGIWTYRKWNSGTAECWGMTSVAQTYYAANGGYLKVSQSLPSGLFNATPNIVIPSGRIQGNIQASIGFSAPDNASSIQTYLINRATAGYNQPGGVYWTVKGTWKTFVAPTTVYRWHRTA